MLNTVHTLIDEDHQRWSVNTNMLYSHHDHFYVGIILKLPASNARQNILHTSTIYFRL